MTEMFERPKCECYRDPTMGDLRDTMIAQIGEKCSFLFGRGLDMTDTCGLAQGHALEMVIVTLATVAALRGTKIECGTQEAQWETERILTGIEARVLHKVRWMHEQARLPENAEITKLMRETTR